MNSHDNLPVLQSGRTWLTLGFRGPEIVMGYTFSIGTDDPRDLTANSDSSAIEQAITMVRQHHSDDLRRRPEAVLTLLGPNGLLTRPSERLDEFIKRLTIANPAADPKVVQPGDTNTPDCNGD